MHQCRIDLIECPCTGISILIFGPRGGAPAADWPTFNRTLSRSYVVAETTGYRHVLFGLSVANGAVPRVSGSGCSGVAQPARMARQSSVAARSG